MTNSSLHTPTRLSNLTKGTSQEYDLLIIGGGITGAGIALDAASRGLSVFLCEKDDFASGTSSRSTKLIHGGLRYLKQFEFGLVRESGRERAVLHRLATNRVIPEKMLLPITRGGSFSKTAASVGLWLYDRLAGVEKTERRRMLTSAETLQEEPLLRSENLLGGGLYFEYRTDDARLVMDVIKTAVSFGANCFNYLEFAEPVYSNGKISGGKLKESFTGNEYNISAKSVVNASGPWVDSVRGKEKNNDAGNQLRHTKGVHIVVPHAKFPIRHAVYFDVKDGRMVFAVPREETTYIGTTDTDYKSAFEEPEVTKADVEYLLKATNLAFRVNLNPADIISTWAGIRPLVQQSGKNPSQVSRKDEIFISSTGLISIAGGKLTGYRKMAERITDQVVKSLPKKENSPCITGTITLDGNAEMRLVHSAEFAWIKSIFGSNAGKIQEIIHTKKIPAEIAALEYCIQQEGVCILSDFLNRRTGWMLFHPEKAQQWIEECSKYLAQHSGLPKECSEAGDLKFRKYFEKMLNWE